MDFVGFITNNVLLFLALMSALVFVHEYGHYIVGRMCGVRAEVFSIGFGPEVFGWTSRKSGTRWRLSALPLGGYVKFLGDADPSSSGTADSKLSPELRRQSFHAQSLGKRAAIVFGGPAANLIFAVVLMAGVLATVGQPFTPPQVVIADPQGPAAQAGLRTGDTVLSFGGSRIESFEDIDDVARLHPGEALSIVYRRDGQVMQGTLTPKPTLLVDRFGNLHRIGTMGVAGIGLMPVLGAVQAGGPAAQAGLEVGDRILEIDGSPIEHFFHIQRIVSASAGTRLQIKVERGNEILTIEATPRPTEITGPDGATATVGRLMIGGRPPPIRIYQLHEAPGHAVQEIVRLSKQFFTVLHQIVIGLRPAKELSGPIGIAKATGEVSQLGLAAVLQFAIVLSITLGLFNLLPVPMLDGGHLLFYAYEFVRGRPLSQRIQEYGFRLGLTLVLGLMVFATWNDVVSIVAKFARTAG